MKDTKITITAARKRLLDRLAELGGRPWDQVVRERVGADVTITVVVAPDWDAVAHVVAARRRILPTDAERACGACRAAVFLHDPIPRDVTVLCEHCARDTASMAKK